MDEGIILRSIVSLLIKLKNCYDKSISRRIVDAFSAFFRNLGDGSRIIVYFRKYNKNSPFWTNSYFYKLFSSFKAGLSIILSKLGVSLSRILESSRIAYNYNSTLSNIENNMLRSAGIFSGSAAATYLVACLLGGSLDSARLFATLSLIVFSVILYILPFDLRKAMESSIFCRLVRYIFS